MTGYIVRRLAGGVESAATKEHDEAGEVDRGEALFTEVPRR